MYPMSILRIKATLIGGEARAVFLKKAAQQGATSGRRAAGPEFSGKVHSRFERVFNIVLPDGSGSGADVLIGLCRPGVPLSPLHLTIAWQSAASALPVREGEPVLITRRELVFPSLAVDWGEAGEYSTFFRRQDPADPKARLLPASVNNLSARAVAVGLAAGPHAQEGLLPLIKVFDFDSENQPSAKTRPRGERGCAGKGSATGAEQPLSRAFPALCRLSAAVREQRRKLVFSAARDMLGLGPGLTPSGDDFLTGLILADLTWRRLFPSGASLGGEEIWLQLAREADRLTGTVSCQQIRLAAGGAGNEVFERVCWRLLRADERVLTDIPALARFGATSGLDYLAGVVFALRHLLMASV